VGDVTNVILITGFLGSGKTTFLNRITKTFPRDLKLMILMNEFGEIGLDGTLVEGEDLDILEISKGSIFCVCVKTDFIRALNEIAQDLKPDVLIVESTGVANPSDLKKDLKLSIFKSRFLMQDQICIIDAACFQDAYGAFVSVEKQIASSTLFVINKVDLVDAEVIEAIKQIVRTHHPSPEFIETTFSKIPTERFIPGLGPLSCKAGPGPDKRLESPERVSDQALETAIEKLLENPDANATPPDRLLSAVYKWNGDEIDSFRSLVPQFPKGLLRAKGILLQEGDTWLFNLVMSQQTIAPYFPEKDCSLLVNHIVFIGSPEVIKAMETLSIEYPDLAQKSVFDPMKNN